MGRVYRSHCSSRGLLLPRRRVRRSSLLQFGVFHSLLTNEILLANSVLTCFRFESSRFESDTSFDSIINFHAGSPVTRWASTAFGAGIGIGSAYADCSRFFDSSSSATSPKSTETSYFVSQVCLSLLLYALDCVWESLWIGFLDHFLSSHFLENNIGS